MKVHALAYDLITDELCTRETSCHCDTCVTGEFCASWNRHINERPVNHKTHMYNSAMDEVLVQHKVQGNETEDSIAHKIFISEVSVDDYVACLYEDHWYIGKILDMDDEDVQVTFLERLETMFRWPSSPDVIWHNKLNVIHKLDHQEPSGKSKQFWKITQDDMKIIKENYAAHEMNSIKNIQTIFDTCSV